MDNDKPAFPGHGYNLGVTRREVFSMLAMQGILASSAQSYDFEGAAVDAVRQADALIKELDRASDDLDKEKAGE